MQRLLDITISIIALLLFLPFALLIVIILRFTGEGEVFYLQTRMGRYGRPFKIIKFVTMLKDSPDMATGTVTIRNDPRVLPFGRLLRRTKLNEVPQFLNVLKGDMSLVGPRPMALRDFEYYQPEIQERLVRVQPGLTGIGSIVFRDEESIMAKSPKSSLDCYREDIISYKGQLELWYIENQSLWLNLRLLFLTALVVISPGSTFYRKLIKQMPMPQSIS